MTPLPVAQDAQVRRLTPALTRALHVRMFDCGTLEQLRAVGREIRQAYARDDAHRAANAVELTRLRTAYEARLTMLERGPAR